MFINGEHNRGEVTENPEEQRGSMWERDEVGGQPWEAMTRSTTEGNSLEKGKGGQARIYLQKCLQARAGLESSWKHRQITCVCITNCTMRNNTFLQTFKEVHNHYVFKGLALAGHNGTCLDEVSLTIYRVQEHPALKETSYEM